MRTRSIYHSLSSETFSAFFQQARSRALEESLLFLPHHLALNKRLSSDCIQEEVGASGGDSVLSFPSEPITERRRRL